MGQKIINVEQSEYWNEKSGPKWVKNEEALNERLSILTKELFSRANIKKSDKVLDIGCGGGDTTFRVSKLLTDEGHVVGADISHTLLNHAKSKFSNNDSMTFMHCDAQNYSFDENYFDKVISRFGVMFFENPYEAFKNIFGSIRTNGSLNFVCWTNLIENEFITEGMDIITKYTQKVLPEVTKDPGPFAFSDREYINEVLQFAGFKNINIDKVYTSISTKDSAENDAEILMGIGPRARILSEENLSSKKMSMIKNEIIQLCEKRQAGKEITYKACLNYVSATK
ncbi:class I SAM-dependent methyltransferase [Paracoccaceae bacterium]|nr:class I SAM-dependent methyltransferase [Paracoccaceae bacterium]